jgi:hypothetical protein
MTGHPKVISSWAGGPDKLGPGWVNHQVCGGYLVPIKSPTSLRHGSLSIGHRRTRIVSDRADRVPECLIPNRYRALTVTSRELPLTAYSRVIAALA